MAFLSRFLLDILFPRFCFSCGGKMEAKEIGFCCQNCFSKFTFLRGPCCPCCGRFMGTNTQGVCSNCNELKPYFQHGISLFAFTNIGRDFIHALKYKQGTYLSSDIFRMLEHEAERLTVLHQSCFVPVPLHFLRKWKRGYNQSDIIAKALAKHCHGQFCNILKRKVNTSSQTSLTRSERKRNVENAFMLNVKTISPKNRYVLVDDVFTTGATLNACAKVLYQTGARDIHVFTLAHG